MIATLPPIKIEPKQYQKFKQLARVNSKSVSELVRELIADYTTVNSEQITKSKERLSRYRFASDKIDSGQNLDELIYS